MALDRVLAILGLVLAVIGIGLAYYFYVKTIRTKLLAIAYTPPVSLRLPIYDVPPEYLQGENEPSRLFMLLWNRGTAPIERSDFVEPIKILPTEHILRIKTFEQDGAVAATVNEAEKSISVDLLRPGEAIIFLIDAANADYNPTISVVMKSADMSVFLPSVPTDVYHVASIAAGVATFMLPFGIMFGIMYWILPPFAPSQWSLFPLFILFGVAIFMVAGALLPRLVIKRFEDYFGQFKPFIPTKFFELQGRCAAINHAWTSLRSQSKALMAAG